MKKYKAKKSYSDISDQENLLSFGMASKHLWLLEGLEVTLKDLPKGLEEHLSEVKSKKGDK